MLYKLILFVINIIKTIYSLIIFITFLIFQNFKLANKFLTTFNIYGNIEGLEKYYHFKKNNTQGLAIFNHVSVLDGILLLNEIKEPMAFLAAENIFVSLCKNVINKWKCIIIKKNENTTQKINYKINNRKKNDPILFIAPSGSEGMNQLDELKLSDFKTGAFVSLKPILPIIIKYSPHYKDLDDRKETMLNIITNTNYLNYKIKILDPIYPQKNDTIESFRDIVYEKMNTEKNKLKVDKIKKTQNHIFLFVLINILLLLSYLLHTNTIHYSEFILITIICSIILYLKNTHYVYDYLYSNIIYFYTLIILIYSLKNNNPILFIQSLLCIIIYKLCQK